MKTNGFLRRRGADIAAGALYIAVALALFRNLLGRVSSSVVGDGRLHVWEELWHFWWTRRSLASGRSPFFTDMLGFPDGFDVYRDMSSITMPFLSVPLQWALGLTLAYNLIAVSCVVTAAFGAYWLCKRTCGDAKAALVGGLIFGFSPFFLVEMSNGMLENVFGLSLLPFILASFLGLNREYGPRPGETPTTGRRFRISRRILAGIGAAALVCWAALTSWYALFFSAALAALSLAAGMLGRDWRERRGVLTAYATVGIVTVAVTAAPFAAAWRGESGLKRGFDARDAFVGPMTGKVCIDIARFVWPSPPRESAPTGRNSVQVIPFGVYMGMPAAALAVFMLLMPGRKLWFWKAGFVLFLLLALGPYLNIGGDIVKTGGKPMPILNRALIAAAPQAVRLFALHNYRFACPALLFAAALSSLALARLFSMPSVRRLRLDFILPAALALAIPADFGSAMPVGARRFAMPVSGAGIPGVYEALDKEAPGALLDIPISTGGRYRPDIRGRQMYYQTRHLRPIWCEPIWKTAEAPDEPALILAAKRLAAGEQWRMEKKSWPTNLESLSKLGYKFVAAHWDMIPEQSRAALERELDANLGERLTAADAGIAIYRIKRR